VGHGLTHVKADFPLRLPKLRRRFRQMDGPL
jgi:hypothetical protein